MFHLGQLSTLVKGLETPGWNQPGDFGYQMSALAMWGSENARVEEAPLLVEPQAVTITTIHSAKGLEFAVVFLADVSSWRFPTSRARTVPKVPFDGEFLARFDPAALADNANLDGERRLMYVALTRARRYLFVSSPRPSGFFDQVEGFIKDEGGTAATDPDPELPALAPLLATRVGKDVRLVTSFSDLRYFLECPHDFYLRKVLGFAPTIDQAFGYGRGVHNLLRAIHSDPKSFAELAADPSALADRVRHLVDRGLFYLWYTTAEPAENMRKAAVKTVTAYVRSYAGSSPNLSLSRRRNSRRFCRRRKSSCRGPLTWCAATTRRGSRLWDFKSGEKDSDDKALSEDEMRLQVALYALAAKRELEYEPERGLVRYLGGERPDEMAVEFDEETLAEAAAVVRRAAREIKGRRFHDRPQKEHGSRCATCDFGLLCGVAVGK